MKRPLIHVHDAESDETVVREMTKAEYEALLEQGWTPGEETPDATDEPA